jgi:chromosomal replication initiator protein
MHAIGNEVIRQHGIDPTRIAYISGEAFTSSFITSLREHRAEEFRRKWRSVDLFLVDDIQFIAGKEQTKEEFFHTFNTLYQMGKQIVISSDRSPRELRAMDERLRSRFECGLIADIAPPDLETRLAILHRKAQIERMPIPDEVLLYMARLVQSNIRTLEGALVKLIAYASLQNSPVTTELATSVLERYYISAGHGERSSHDDASEHEPIPESLFTYRNGRGVAITPEMVQKIVAKKFGLAGDAMSGKRRDRDTAQARQIAMHLMRELTELSLPGIGQLFGGRDHSTVMYACDKVKSQMETDDDLRRMVEEIVLQLRAQASG